MPTIKDLNSRIPDGIHAECQTLRHYCYWLRELCHGAPEYLNIESVATNILTAQIFPSEEERLRNAELRFELLRFIAQAMHRTVPLSSAASQMLSAFLNAIANDKENEGRKNLILSFNYDTLIEDQIRQDPNLFSSIAVDYGVNIEPADRSACHGNRPKSIDLLKLHGSLNWYSIKGSGGELDLKNVCRIEADDRSYPLYQKDNPIFIPMAHACLLYTSPSPQRFLFAGKPVQCTLGKSGLLPFQRRRNLRDWLRFSTNRLEQFSLFAQAPRSLSPSRRFRIGGGRFHRQTRTPVRQRNRRLRGR